MAKDGCCQFPAAEGRGCIPASQLLVPAGKERAELGIGLPLALMAAAFAFTPCSWARSQGNYIQPWLCAERRRRRKGNLSQGFLHLSDVALGSKFHFTCKTAHSVKTGLERCYELIFRAAKESTEQPYPRVGP